MPHDQLFKELLQTFFREFMELFYADVAARLDFSRVTFIDKELFTDLPDGSQREADLVAQVYTLDGEPEIILAHIEVEARRKNSMPLRMFEYYMMLRLRHRIPTFPIVVYLSPGAGGLTAETHEDRVFDHLVNLFTYQAVGLPDLQADDYHGDTNLLGAALSALMRPSRLGKVAQKYASLRAMAHSRMDEARIALLTNVVEVYLKLEPAEQQAFEEMVATPEGEEVARMISVYEQRGMQKGIEQGIEQGVEQGILRGKKTTVLRQMEVKFGELPERVRVQVEAISDPEELDRLADLIVTADSLNQMRLPGD